MSRFAAVALAALMAAAGAHAEGYKVPRTRFGQPDLQGIWTNTSLTWLQRPPIFKGLVATDAEEAMMLAGFRKMAGPALLETHVDPHAPAPPEVQDAPQADILEMDLSLARIDGQKRSSWIVEPADGRLPFTDAGKRAAREASRGDRYDGPEVRPVEERCLIAIGSTEGPPMMNGGFNGHIQIVQAKDHVAIEVEMNHDVRIIRLNDRTHPPASVRPWMGDSVGWWEGDTLVVETTNFHPRTYIGSLTGGFAYSPSAKLIERFTRKAKDLILYEFSVDDPEYFKTPWRAEMPWRPAKGPIYEYACHEGNYSLRNILAGARFEEQAAKKTP